MSRFCVIEGTKITLNNKETLPIEKIKAGQEILSFNLNTLQKSQKNDTLLKLSTDTFDGVFQEDLIKNIWKNEVEEYYSINNKLKITGDHIVLGKRDNTFYWTTVDKLLIGDYLFTDQNIFEKIDMIILIKEKVKVYNLQVNDVYNYFANSYLIHNGAPCGASCADCGVAGFTSFTLTLTSNDYEEEPYEITINSIMRSFNGTIDQEKAWTSGMDLDVKYYISWNHGQVGHNVITFSNPSGLTLLDKDDNPKTTWNGSAVISSSNAIFVTFTSATSTLDYVTAS